MYLPCKSNSILLQKDFNRYGAFSFAQSKFRTPTTHDRPDFCSIQTILQKVENEADEIFDGEEGLNVASHLGAPLDEGREMHVELQNKHRNGSQ